MTSLLVSAKLGGTHGLKGELKCYPVNEDYDYLFDLDACVLRTSDGKERNAEVESIRESSGFLLIKFRGFDNPEKARALSGSLLKIDRSLAAPLEEGEFYVADFYGLEVWCQGVRRGVVTDTAEGAQALLLYVETEAGTRMIPYLPVFVSQPDLEKGTIEVLMPGLLD